MARSKQDYYFAYGSNLYQSRLQMRVPSAYFISLGKLQGYQLLFNKVGLDRSGKGNIEPTGRPEDLVWGAVFQLDASEIPLLDRVESLGVGYERQYLNIVTPHSSFNAFTYLALLKDNRLSPFHWYKAYVVQGAMNLGLPAAYIQTIQAVQSRPDLDADRCHYHSAIQRCS